MIAFMLHCYTFLYASTNDAHGTPTILAQSLGTSYYFSTSTHQTRKCGSLMRPSPSASKALRQALLRTKTRHMAASLFFFANNAHTQSKHAAKLQNRSSHCGYGMLRLAQAGCVFCVCSSNGPTFMTCAKPQTWLLCKQASLQACQHLSQHPRLAATLGNLSRYALVHVLTCLVVALLASSPPRCRHLRHSRMPHSLSLEARFADT